MTFYWLDNYREAGYFHLLYDIKMKPDCTYSTWCDDIPRLMMHGDDIRPRSLGNVTLIVEEGGVCHKCLTFYVNWYESLSLGERLAFRRGYNEIQ